MPEESIRLSSSVARFLDTSRRYFGLAEAQRAGGRRGREKGSGFGASFVGQRGPVPLPAKS